MKIEEQWLLKKIEFNLFFNHLWLREIKNDKGN